MVGIPKAQDSLQCIEQSVCTRAERGMTIDPQWITVGKPGYNPGFKGLLGQNVARK